MLSDAQRSSLAARLRQGRERLVDTIPRRGPEISELPLSFGQEQLWFIDQFAPGLSVYNLASVVRLRGELDAAALAGALDDLVARHEALRTRMVNVGGSPVQVVDPPGSRQLALDYLSGSDPAAHEARLRDLAAEEAARPFDLAGGPLLRARLVRLAPHEHALLTCVHHTVFDGWSFGIFLRELTAFYQARTTATPAGLPELPIQFADYALWERRRLRGEALDDLIGYWKKALDGVGTVQLPTDHPRPLLQSFDGGVERLPVSGDVLDRLRALSRRNGTTLFVTLLSALQVLLHRYSGQDDITVGTASANRTRPELAPLVGYLVNTLPIRTNAGGDPTFVELLHRVRATTVEAYDHQDLPFAKLVEALRVDRDPSRSPLFQVGFTMTENAEDTFRSGDLTMSVENVEIMPAKVDLNLFVEVQDSGMCLLLSYATALFEPATVRAMLEHLRVLLTGIVADPTRRLSQLPLLTPADLHRELVEWNDTAVSYPVTCVHQAFEAQVERTPDGVAAVLGTDQLTYRQLNAQANQVARALHRRGISPDTLVGISMPPSLRRLAALLGIMKAGAGYVPLDPDLPAERLAYMISDARIPLIVTDTAGGAELPSTDAQTVDLDRQWPAIAAEPNENPHFPVTPDNIVYVIYTSGSTGRPKGVVLEHAPVVNYLHGMIRHWPVGPGDRNLQFASLSFDVSVMDMFVALCSGATAVLTSREILHSPPRLADLMRRQQVTFACLPPAVLTLLTGQSLPDLRVLVSAGEALSTDLVRQWLRPGLRFCNGYGPTETACGVTLMELDADTLPPPIGFPMPNYRAYVLDRKLNPLPVGAIGELHIGGACHAREYLNQPDLTRQRFIASPFDDDPGARLYKTGDLVRRQPDGNIQFIGRIDNQVKIRGLRIELGEIETALAGHPAVAQAHVVTADDTSGQKHLIGYARTDPDAAPTTLADLRQHLARQLPAYMVPTHLLVLDRFPLTSNGKIDNKALPHPDTAVTDYTAPRTLLETMLVDIYATLLGNRQVGIDNSFFDLGGNSLQAMQLVTRLHSELAVTIGVTAIFLAPTPRQLAALLRDKHGFEDADLDADGLQRLDAGTDPQPSSHDERVVELSSGPGEQPLFLVHAIGGTVYGYAKLAKELADTHQVYGVAASGLTPASTAATSLDEMVPSYVAAIRAAQPHGPYQLAGWSMGGLVAFEVARRLEDLGESVALLALLDTPFSPPAFVPAESFLVAMFVGDVARTLGWPLGDAPDTDQLDWLAARLDAGTGDIAAARAEVGRRFTVFTANTTMIAGYRPTGRVHTGMLIAGAQASPNSAPDWAALVDGPVEAIRVPGGHYTLLQPPNVGRIAEAIRRRHAASRPGAASTGNPAR